MPDRMEVSGSTAKMDIRSGLTTQFLMAAVSHARSSVEMESRGVETITEEDKVSYRGFVISALLQSVAALECEIWDVVYYGPGHHLGSPHIEGNAKKLLKPLAELIDGQPVLERFRIVLHLLNKTGLDPGSQPWQDTSLVIRLRNELVHYKSRWGEELDELKFIKALKQKKHAKPFFMVGKNTNFFPYECLSAACATWAVRSCIAFLNVFSSNLGFPDRLAPYQERLKLT